MKRFNHGIKWTLAAVLLAGVTAAPVMAEKTTPATGKNSAVPAVPRAIPDLIPYHKFDPPQSKLFDISKLTISGDLRVRPEFRNNNFFGDKKANAFFVQQWARLGFNYSISPDVAFFFQPQYSKNWGSGPGLDANSSGASHLCPPGLHAGAELPGAEPDHQSRAAIGGVGQPSHVRAFRLEQRGLVPRRPDHELQGQQEHHTAGGLVADERSRLSVLLHQGAVVVVPVMQQTMPT